MVKVVDVGVANAYTADKYTADKPVYRYVGDEEDSAETPCEIHQAANHFMLHGGVPIVYKLKYALISFGVVLLQILSMAGVILTLKQRESRGGDRVRTHLGDQQ